MSDARREATRAPRSPRALILRSPDKSKNLRPVQQLQDPAGNVPSFASTFVVENRSFWSGIWSEKNKRVHAKGARQMTWQAPTGKRFGSRNLHQSLLSESPFLSLSWSIFNERRSKVRGQRQVGVRKPVNGEFWSHVKTQ